MRARIFFLLLLVHPHLNATPGDSCGEQSGHIDNITGSIMTQVLPVETIGGVSEVVFLSRAKKLIYRNQQNQLFSNSFVDGSSKMLFDSLQYPLSHAVHPQEKYLALDGFPWVFNLPELQWQSWGEGPGPMALFWTHSPTPELVAVEKKKNRAETFFTVYRYEPESQSLKSCEIHSQHASKYQVVRGDTDPFVQFYYPTYVAGKGVKVNFSRFRPEADIFGRCLPAWNPWPLKIAQPEGVELQDLYQYGISGATALTFNNPERPVVIHYRRSRDDDPGTCYVFNTSEQLPVIVTSAKPTVVGWSFSGGMSVYNIDQGKGTRVDFLSALSIHNLDSKRVWEIPEESSVLVGPDIGARGNRTIFKVSMQPK